MVVKPGRMGNRLNATGTTGRLPTTEELDEEQDIDGSDVEHEHGTPKASVVGSDRRQSLAVSLTMYLFLADISHDNDSLNASKSQLAPMDLEVRK